MGVVLGKGKGSPRSVRDPLKSQDTLRLNESGAGLLLGDLERRLMEAAWAAGCPESARELHDRVARSHKVASITSVTVVNRLVRKGLMRRAKDGDVFHYSATLSRQEFMTRASRHVVRGIMGLGSSAVATSLVDLLAERDPDQLAELGRLVRKKLRDADK
ncbi:MAG TPA: BlaI/MecI/CopY family transcriptional regulator [Gemmatimonadaceae bacterium]|nr:BlaI/MecI/CopY family transcriptional regulator [Gemmatimonadaceae bacterium]